VQVPADAPLAVAPMRGGGFAAAIADAADAGGVALPGVFGPAGTASRFAGAWAGLRKVAAMPTSAERLYEVRGLRFPAGVDGALRRAAEDDRALLLSWLPGFEAGAGWAGSDPAAVFVTRRLAAGDVWIWDDEGPVSMAAHRGRGGGIADPGRQRGAPLPVRLGTMRPTERTRSWHSGHRRHGGRPAKTPPLARSPLLRADSAAGAAGPTGRLPGAERNQSA
jgi:hypothetical protein